MTTKLYQALRKAQARMDSASSDRQLRSARTEFNRILAKLTASNIPRPKRAKNPLPFKSL